MRLALAIHALVFGLLCAPVTAQAQPQISQTAQDALLYTLAHEIGHAFLREFDLPVLGPEEDLADDFATIYVYLKMPDRAEAIIAAAATQKMADGEQPEMFSEYRNDDQRAGRSICLLYGQDPDRFAALATSFGLEGEEAANCRDFATEVGRSWRRTLAPYQMPTGARVTEVGLRIADNSQMANALATDGWRGDAHTLLSGIDWHSQVTLMLDACDGAAWWARNGRRITICDQYIARVAGQLTD